MVDDWSKRDEKSKQTKMKMKREKKQKKFEKKKIEKIEKEENDTKTINKRAPCKLLRSSIGRYSRFSLTREHKNGNKTMKKAIGISHHE